MTKDSLKRAPKPTVKAVDGKLNLLQKRARGLSVGRLRVLPLFVWVLCRFAGLPSP